jgi:hypothetical protein
MRLVSGVLMVGNRYTPFELFQPTILWRNDFKTA